MRRGGWDEVIASQRVQMVGAEEADLPLVRSGLELVDELQHLCRGRRMVVGAFVVLRSVSLDVSSLAQTFLMDARRSLCRTLRRLFEDRSAASSTWPPPLEALRFDSILLTRLRQLAAAVAALSLR